MSGINIHAYKGKWTKIYKKTGDTHLGCDPGQLESNEGFMSKLWVHYV